eukprot:TRINITY_DN20341_c0_g2_i1.p1 TRINITY_DN20341_c0_g2~~TRINITY_DN20341_c0_g2_i1.p1  ORF type:complete len:195 (+),score=50.23 TRINITY_DN20341_c0_g2_i1:183-767(+)
MNQRKDDRFYSSSSSKGKGIMPMNRKIETPTTKKSVVDLKQKPISNLSKSEVKGKSTSILSKTIASTTTVKVKTQKKVYTLPGQKYDPPEEREPLRIFYESLSKQIPSSEMAEFWMMEHGLLSPPSAKKAYERKQRRQQQLRTGTPIKSPKAERPESSQRHHASKNGELKTKKRILDFSDDDDDFIIKRKKVKG